MTNLVGMEFYVETLAIGSSDMLLFLFCPLMRTKRHFR